MNSMTLGRVNSRFWMAIPPKAIEAYFLTLSRSSLGLFMRLRTPSKMVFSPVRFCTFPYSHKICRATCLLSKRSSGTYFKAN